MWKLALLIITVIFLLELFNVSQANPLCQPCLSEECDREPDDCSYGVVHNYCGRKVCAKGPGKRCGGPSGVNGECGEGMHCLCELCTGCSLRTFECFRPPSRGFLCFEDLKNSLIK